MKNIHRIGYFIPIWGLFQLFLCEGEDELDGWQKWLFLLLHFPIVIPAFIIVALTED